MNHEVPPRVRRSSSVLVFTFILGIAIGFSLAYAVFDSLHWNFAEKKACVTSANTPTELPAPPDTAIPATAPPEPADVPEEPAEGEIIPSTEPAAPVEAAAAADVNGLWPARHVFITLAGAELQDAEKTLLAEFKPGGVILQAENLVDEEQTKKLVQQIKEAAGLGTEFSSLPFIAVAQEGGPDFNPLKVEPAPSAADLGQKNDPEDVKRTARSYADAARNRGISVLLAPMLDPFVAGLSPETIKPRSFGEKPRMVTTLGLAFIDGVLEGGVTPVAKFYPALSAAVSVDNVLTIQKTEVRALAELLYSFSEAAAHKVPCLLAAHVAVPGLDRDEPKRPAPFSPKMIQHLLRGQWAYEGVVLADDLASPFAPHDTPVEELAVACLGAGCDAMILSQATPERMTAICQAIASACAAGGVLGPERLSVSKARLEAWQKRLTELTPASKDKPSAPPPVVSQPPNTKLVKHRVQKGETLKGIAKKYGVRSNDLMTWNHLAGPDIRFDTDLVVFVPETPAKEEPTPAITPETVAPQPPVPITEQAAPAETAPAPPVPDPAAPKATEMAPELPSPEKQADSGTTPPAALPEGTPPPEPVNPAEAAPSPETPASPEPAKPAEAAPSAEPSAPAPESTTPPSAPPVEEPAPAPQAEAQEIPSPPPAETKPAPAEAKPIETEYDTYTVSKGDNLRRIAERFHIPEAELAKLNQISDPNLIKEGQRIKVPKK